MKEEGILEKNSLELLFIYNANSGLGNAMLDAAHKIMQPSTYSCSLCQLTYGAVQEKREWKRFRQESALPMRFLHKDEFMRAWGDRYGRSLAFPVIMLQTGNQLYQMVDAAELNAMDSVDKLIQRVKEIIKIQLNS